MAKTCFCELILPSDLESIGSIFWNSPAFTASSTGSISWNAIILTGFMTWTGPKQSQFPRMKSGQWKESDFLLILCCLSNPIPGSLVAFFVSPSTNAMKNKIKLPSKLQSLNPTAHLPEEMFMMFLCFNLPLMYFAWWTVANLDAKEKCSSKWPINHEKKQWNGSQNVTDLQWGTKIAVP